MTVYSDGDGDLELLAAMDKARAYGLRVGREWCDTQYLPGGGRDTARDAKGRAARMLANLDEIEVPAFLSGEWAGEVTVRSLCEMVGWAYPDLGDDDDAECVEAIAGAFEAGATDGYVDTIATHLAQVAKGGA